jgi:hypothetical protein
LAAAPPFASGSMRHLASFGDSGSSFSFEMPDRGPPRAYGGVRASPFQPPPVMEGALGPIEPLSFQHRGWMDKNGWACSKTCRYLDGRCVVRQHHARGLQRTLEWRDNDELRIPPLNRFLRPHSPLSTLSQMDRSENPVGAIDTCSSVACWTPKAVSRASRCSVVPRAHRPSVSGTSMRFRSWRVRALGLPPVSRRRAGAAASAVDSPLHTNHTALASLGTKSLPVSMLLPATSSITRRALRENRLRCVCSAFVCITGDGECSMVAGCSCRVELDLRLDLRGWSMDLKALSRSWCAAC